jgi:hypothetical protein
LALLDESILLHEDVNNNTIEQLINTDTTESMTVPSSLIDTTKTSSQDIHIPIICTIDKPSTSLPTTITMSEYYLRACVGLCRVDTMKKNFNNLYLDSIMFDALPLDAMFWRLYAYGCNFWTGDFC